MSDRDGKSKMIVCPMCGQAIEESPNSDVAACPSCGTEVVAEGRDEAQRAKALRRIRPPAVGLITVGTLMVAFGIIGGFGILAEEVFWHFQSPAEGRIYRVMNPEFFLSLASYVISPFVGSVLIFGGARMRRLRSRRWALAAAIAAFVPTTLFAFSFPIAIWSLIVLTRPSVKAVFR